MITGIDHVQVAIPRGQEQPAREFYGHLLGMAEIPKPPALRQRGGCWFQSGSAVLHLGVDDPFVPARRAHPAFLVGDLDGLQGRLTGAGYDCLRSDGEMEGVRRFHTHSMITGHLVQLSACPEPDPNRAWSEAGEVVRVAWHLVFDYGNRAELLRRYPFLDHLAGVYR